MPRTTRRRILAGSAALASTGVLSRPARAATKITFLTSWFAQAEHGGFYQAKASGLYDKAGLDVTIKMGGPQVNALQLLTAGEADIIMGYDIQTLGAVAKGLPVVCIGTSFQYDLQGVMTHADINSIADLKGHTILIATSSHVTFWPLSLIHISQVEVSPHLIWHPRTQNSPLRAWLRGVIKGIAARV